MALYATDSDFSDDEIFFGKLTLKEAKQGIFLGKQRQTISYTPVNKLTEDDNNASIKIIETHSAPDIGPTVQIDSVPIEKSVSNPCLTPHGFSSKWNMSVSDESFLKMEQLVTELCMSPKREELESKIDIDITDHETKSTTVSDGSDHETKSTTASDGSLLLNSELMKKLEVETKTLNKQDAYKSPSKETHLAPKTPSSAYQTPRNKQPDFYATPSTGTKTPFKTPGNPVQKKTSVTPLKKPFQHVMSPVAFYINNCPKVPLVTEVRPKRPLPSSSIPKLIKSASKPNPGNKENVTLPSVAYRNAKETKVITIPDEDKLPKSQWAKHVKSSIPNAVVIKHDHREISTKKTLFHRQEDSFADLSLYQADVSVCTQKSAFKKPK